MHVNNHNAMIINGNRGLQGVVLAPRRRKISEGFERAIDAKCRDLKEPRHLQIPSKITKMCLRFLDVPPLNRPGLPPCFLSCYRVICTSVYTYTYISICVYVCIYIYIYVYTHIV